MPELAPAPADGPERSFLAFKIDERFYALPATDVAEIVRIPALARVPQAPPGLCGLANLRGRVTPVASLQVLLGGEAGFAAPSGLALLLAGAAPVAVAIEGAPVLVSVRQVQTDERAILAQAQTHVIGVFSMGGDTAVRVLDIQALLKQAFTPRAGVTRKGARGVVAQHASGRNEESTEEKYISFLVAGQEFALELDAVREVIMAPSTVASMPHSDDMVIGVAAYRQSLLPLLSLRGLLGLGQEDAGSSAKVVVSRVGGALVGLVADQAKAIVSVAAGESDPPPAVLAARTGGESQIKAIYRADHGRRLISILSPDQLFRDEVMQRLSKTHSAKASEIGGEAIAEAADRFLVFRLGDDEFALPIEAVIEVARVPDQITRVPKTPAFLEGVMSFRGEVLPVVDQRRRFDMAVREGDMSRRLIMVRSERHRAALVVDSVTEVLSLARGDMDPAPDLTGDQTRLVLGVINLEDAGRMVMVLDPVELLSRTERGLLDVFTPELPEVR